VVNYHRLIQMSKPIRISAEMSEYKQQSAAAAFRTQEPIKPVGRPELGAALEQVGSKESIQRTREIICHTSGKIASIDR